jgi:hypothetical protein
MGARTMGARGAIPLVKGAATRRDRAIEAIVVMISRYDVVISEIQALSGRHAEMSRCGWGLVSIIQLEVSVCYVLRRPITDGMYMI